MNFLYPLIRWVIFIPASILGGLVFHAILMFMNQHKFVLFFPVDISGNVIIVFSCAFLSGMVTIWIGAYLAPYFRKQVVIGYLIVTALGVLSMIFLGTFTKYSVMENFRYTAYVMGIFLMGWVLYNIQIDKAKENPID